MIKEKILVAGATGYVGGLLVPLLLEKGFSVRCMARNPAKLAAREWKTKDRVAADTLDPASLDTAMERIDIAYYLIHAMGSKGDFKRKDIQSAQNFARAASRAGIQRIVYLGGLGREADGLSDHLRNRQEVGRVLSETGISVTELRASIIIGAGSASFEIIRDLVKKLPVMITPRWVQSRAEPIAVDDVLFYLIACLEESRTINQVLEIGGGEILTYGGMMKQVAAVMNKRLVMIKVPVLTPHLSAYWLNLMTTVPMSLAFSLVEGLRNDTICHDHRIRKWIPRNLIPFQEAVRRALNQKLPDSRWTEASGESKELLSEKDRHFFKDERLVHTDVRSEKLFGIIQRIGGENGWYYASRVWRLRGFLDRLIGGVGMRRGRRHPVQLRAGDAVDFWRLETMIPGKMIKLRAEMKLPGTAWLQFKVSESARGSVLEQTAIFEPDGFFGQLYWIVLKPVHFFIFRNMARNIAAVAERKQT
ncbi:DUF2867 domain-containing protein [candidate division KSB1 bacterium]|nr:DUF2867 domain-containing protein [candidate division KSB1 bacterium]